MDKSTISLETDHDKNLRVLAITLAKCRRYLKYGYCSMQECTMCQTNQKFRYCYDQLPACDQLNVENQSGELLSMMGPMRPKTKVSPKLAKFILISVIVTSILLGIAGFCTINPAATAATDDMVERCYNEYRRINGYAGVAWDMNGDGLSNCIDSSVLWKLCWDRLYPNNRNLCEMVWNYNKDCSYNHLFIRIRYAEDWDFIEPQQTFSDRHNIITMNGLKVDFRNNHYGITDLWMDLSSESFTIRNARR